MRRQTDSFKIGVPDQIKSLLKSTLISTQYDIDAIYASFYDYFNQQFFDLIPVQGDHPTLNTGHLNSSFSIVQSKNIRTAGIDFPLLMRKESVRPVLMVCAMDPLRADGGQLPDNNLSYWVPFSIIKNPAKEKKYSERENLAFFHALLEHHDLYVTDVYKVFYREETALSNMQSEYTSLPIHKEILQEEINIIKPDAILTLGNKARNAICRILDLDVPTWSDKVHSTFNKSGGRIVMVPHISGSANGAKSKILKNNVYRQIQGSGNERYANIILRAISSSPV